MHPTTKGQSKLVLCCCQVHYFIRRLRKCRLVNEVLQRRKRVKDLFGRAPVERTHREIVISPFSYDKLLFEVVERIKAVQSVKLFVVLAVAAFHFAVMPRSIRPYEFVADAQFLQGLLKERKPF